MEFPSVNHDKGVRREQLSRESRKRSEGEGKSENIQG